MNIEISKEAEKHIMLNGKNAFVTVGKVGGCCGGNMPVPSVYLGLPQDKSCYVENTIGDLSIFVDKNIDSYSKIIVSLSKMLWFKMLYLEVRS